MILVTGHAPLMELRNLLTIGRIHETIDPAHFYPTVKAAVRAFRDEYPEDAPATAPDAPVAESEPP